MASANRAGRVPILMKTRSSRPLVSPSLGVTDPLTRAVTHSPSLGATRLGSEDVPVGFFRPVSSSGGRGSPSLDVRALLTNDSPSLGQMGARNGDMCTEDAGASSSAIACSTTTDGPNMTTAICKRASRMARPAEPSSEAMVAAVAIVNARETVLRERGLERIAAAAGERFKLAGASTGKGPAVKADTGDADADITAQATMNQCAPCLKHCDRHSSADPHELRSLFGQYGSPQKPPRRLRQPRTHLAAGHAQRVPRHVWQAGGGGHQEVPCLGNRIERAICFHSLTIDYLSFPRSNAVNASVTQRSKTQGAANQVRDHFCSLTPPYSSSLCYSGVCMADLKN